jgi:hypothetical protein
MNTDTILVVSNQVVGKSSKINWPDLNYPNSGQTILRTVYDVNYDALTIQLDSCDGPTFNLNELPNGVGFYKKLVKSSQKSK